MGFPVALKAIGPSMLHKTERGGPARLADEGAVRAAAEAFASGFAEMTGFLVQRMVPEGVEMLVGALHDPTFGPVIACGTGGVLVDLLRESVFRLHPMTSEDATEMSTRSRAPACSAGIAARHQSTRRRCETSSFAFGAAHRVS